MKKDGTFNAGMRWFGEKKEKEEKEISIGDKYAATLVHSPYGVDVLVDILVDKCHFGSTLNPDNPAEVAEYNVGISILSDVGVLTQENAEKAIRAMIVEGAIPKIKNEGEKK